jgi:hypothetical protein
MQRKLSAKCEESQLSDLNIASRIKGSIDKEQPQDKGEDGDIDEEAQNLRQQIRFESNSVPAFGEIVQS